MDEVIISGKKYISSKRAARTSGYASDYIGQLVRESKLQAVKVGRAWFIAEQGLQELIAEPGDLTIVNQPTSLPPTWSPVIYMNDDAPLYPVRISDKREELILGHATSTQPTKFTKAQHQTGVQVTSFDGIRKMPDIPAVIATPTVAPIVHFKLKRLVGYLLAILSGLLVVSFFVLLISIFY